MIIFQLVFKDLPDKTGLIVNVHHYLMATVKQEKMDLSRSKIWKRISSWTGVSSRKIPSIAIRPNTETG
jgi:hypothetical protein